ncbi:flavin reductase family protein [Methanobacterium alcaliphilum]|uniref:flavin reductase family protein n=1 Tax=Methanobacterium alcaliphilum TaxID=392018 RepID=UPI00200B7B39|nr:flavin reductase family protein [Methanobacterium alcaliphilum]MCK9151066.1 flavin reductase family protein [Methanobacterium alcaliphilum]
MILKNFKRESLIPLPVTFISTISEEGIRNIAPYSCIMPVLRPFDLICVASAKMRDTFVNIKSTKEFVINLAGANLVDKVIPTSSHVPFDVNEFELADLKERPSKKVKAPGIEGCYAWMECKLHSIYEEEYQGFPYLLIMGQVVHLEIKDNVYNPHDGSWDVESAKPLMMVGSDEGMHFCTIEDINKFEPFGAMFPDGKDPLSWMYND